jgi:ribosomal protein S18 acetylase RimI-like enzyme
VSPRSQAATPIADQTAVTDHPLDNPVWAALTGPHDRFAQTHGRAGRYQPDVSPFAALAARPDGSAWADLAQLAGHGEDLLLAGVPEAPPPGWTVLGRERGVQMVDVALAAAPDPEAQLLGPGDVPDLLDLVARTEPGPIRPRTIELGRYLGIRRNGTLVALAGERLRLPGWTEISAVCTDEAHRGQGLASRLLRAVAAGIRSRGGTPFLHALASNTGAVRLYESMGFRLRRTITFSAVRVPDDAVSPATGR